MYFIGYISIKEFKKKEIQRINAFFLISLKQNI